MKSPIIFEQNQIQKLLLRNKRWKRKLNLLTQVNWLLIKWSASLLVCFLAEEDARTQAQKLNMVCDKLLMIYEKKQNEGKDMKNKSFCSPL